MQSKPHSVPFIFAFCICLASWSCAKSSDAPASVGEWASSASLSDSQNIFETTERNGGTYTLSWNVPFGGGTLVKNSNFFYSASSGGLSSSPFYGPQTQVSVFRSLDSLLTVPSLSPSRYLRSGKVWLVSSPSSRKVTYVKDAIRYDYLAADGSTVLTSVLISDVRSLSLSGNMSNSPVEFLASIPVDQWVGFHNFSGNAKWLPGSAYLKKTVSRVGDVAYAEDCGNSSVRSPDSQATTNPCQAGTTLDQFFPITLNGGSGHPYETDFASDGVITQLQGLRAWIANSPRPADQDTNPTFRVFYEADGNVYMGSLQKDGTLGKYAQSDGSVVGYSISLSQRAVESIQRGLITGAVAPGSSLGRDTEVPTDDLFGIGGHGPNGALAPADLRVHYNIPAGLTGAGQTVAIVDAPGMDVPLANLNVFSRYFGLPTCNAGDPCFQQIDLSNGASALKQNDWGSEVALDTQMIHAIAPAAKIVLVTAASHSGDDVMSAVNYAAALPGVVAVSMSFDYNTSYQAAEDPKLADFQQNLGKIFFASSGDAGYFGSGGYPASSAYVTAVGGTRINSVTDRSSANSEVLWQFSGSGYNPTVIMPDWQSALWGAAAEAENFQLRAIPDVSAVADFQHSAVSVYYRGGWQMSGGTSASAPIWAGISALLAEQLAKNGNSLSALVKSTPGGFNGLLYHVKLSQRGTAAFFDITSGTNDLTSTDCPACLAGPGVDSVSGLGTPDVSALFSYF